MRCLIRLDFGIGISGARAQKGHGDMNHIHRESRTEITGRHTSDPAVIGDSVNGYTNSARVMRVCGCGAESFREAYGWTEWQIR